MTRLPRLVLVTAVLACDSVKFIESEDVGPIYVLREYAGSRMPAPDSFYVDDAGSVVGTVLRGEIQLVGNGQALFIREIRVDSGGGDTTRRITEVGHWFAMNTPRQIGWCRIGCWLAGQPLPSGGPVLFGELNADELDVPEEITICCRANNPLDDIPDTLSSFIEIRQPRYRFTRR